MGQNNSKKSLKTINDDVQAIRSSIRQSKGNLRSDSKEALEHVLINYSKQVDTMSKTTKRKSIDKTQRLIVDTTNELLTNNSDENLDRGAVETNSFINLTKTKKSSDNSKNLSTLDEVEKTISSLKLDVNVAISNHDNERLKLLRKSIENLATELEMITVDDYIDLQKRKEHLEKILQNLYGKINKTRRQIERDGNIQYLTEYEQKQQQLINDLIGIETILENTPQSINELENLKQQIDQIDGDETVVAKKQEILSQFHEKYEEILIIEQKLQQAIDSLGKFQKEIEKISQNPNSEEVIKAENYLKQLRDYVGKLPDINREFSERRQQFYKSLEQSSNLLSKQSSNNQRNIDGFYSYWMAIQENFQPENYNFSELSSIHQLLSTILVLIQQKVDEIGHFLQQKSSKNSPDLVKVKVKITESPQHYSSINLQQIENELIKLKREINEASDCEIIKKSLNDYREILKNSQTSSSSNELLSLIDEIWENLETKRRLSGNRNSSDDILNDIFVISSQVNDYGAKLNHPNVSNTELEVIRGNLLEYRNYLLGVNPEKPNIKKVCDDVLQQITKYLCYIDDNPHMTTLKKRVNVLKEKIDRFSGTYKNVLYKKLEDDLNDCLVEAGNLQLRNEIGNYLKILEEKSIKDTNYNRPTTTTVDVREKLSKIRQDVDDVINDLSNNDLKTKDDYLPLDGRLTLSILALDNLQITKDRNLLEERENLYHEIQRYLNYINEKIALAEQSLPIDDNSNDNNNDDDDDDDVIIVELRTEKLENHQQEIDEIESKFERIRREIDEFIGDQTNEKFTKLDDELIEITLNLDKYKFDRNTELNNKKLQLLKNIQNACELLDEKVNHYEQLQLIEQQINEIVIKIQQFHLNQYNNFDYNRLDEQLINLNVKTRKLQVDQQLLEKRNHCIKMIEDCFRQLSKNHEGTLV